MFGEWLVYTVLIFIIIYLLIMLNYNKALYKREMTANKIKKGNIDDSKLMIRKYRVQLQRAIGNIDILTEELNKVRNDIKTLRARNSQNRLENDLLTQKIKELEERIEALI
jgi:peptidoglycan hydrolase CwlO-like protein